MRIAFYIGNHAADSWPVRLGCYLTRLAQKGEFKKATHCEAIHEELPDGSCVIASSSLRDGGVRLKTVTLNPENWRIVNVHQWNVKKSIELMSITKGEPYDLRGALATVLPGKQQTGRWFCNEWIGAPYLQASYSFQTAQFMAICLSLGAEVTQEFFLARKGV